MDWGPVTVVYMTDLLWDDPARVKTLCHVALSADTDTLVISNKVTIAYGCPRFTTIAQWSTTSRSVLACRV